MRYLGNKTKLLPAIESLLDERGVRPPGTFCDVFTGTATVARRMKQLGWRVIANDHLACAATQARAGVGQDGAPALEGVLARPEVRAFARSSEGRALADAIVHVDPSSAHPDELGALRPLRVVLAYLNACALDVEGLVFRQYSSGGPAGRGFFTDRIGRRIDGVRATIARWKAEGSLDPAEEPVLLAALIDAADRSANISGTYGAFLKKWQSNALGPLVLRAPVIVPGKGSTVHCRDSNALVREVECDVLYVDPPYNRRQYAKNYHVLEVLAELASVEDEAAYEATIYGRTGLRDFADRRSDYCLASARGGASPCERAFEDLILNARAKHFVISYNEEGILSGTALARILGKVCPGFTLERGLVEVSYRRFRSDRDEGKRRQYRVLEGRRRDEVREWLIFATAAKRGHASLDPRRPVRVRRAGSALKP